MGTQHEQIRANHAPLSPLSFLYRTAAVFGQRTSLVYGSRRYSWSETLDRCRRLASALSSRGISTGDVVSVLAPNIPALYEMHFGVPMSGAILNAINIRLDPRTVSVLLRHSGCKLLFVDEEFLPLALKALDILSSSSSASPTLIPIRSSAVCEYEKLVASGDAAFPLELPEEEQCIALNYTSGTTSSPKGVLYTHRGAYLNSIASVLFWGMKSAPIYLWTLPMFHCNGWCFTWGVAAQAGTNICMRNVSGPDTFDAIAEHGVTHLCGAPIVLNMIVAALDNQGQGRRRADRSVEVITGGAPPPSSILSKMEEAGFQVTHSYGLTETYGPALVCEWMPHWNSFPLEQRATLKSRQGVVHLALHEADVKDPQTMVPVPRDGKTLGEVMVRGSTVMKGYFKDEEGTRKAFEGGWFHTGDLGVVHPDGYVQLKDRSKDIIISGGENISSIEVESILYAHPSVMDAAVVARPDDYWGETPCAFVAVKEGDHTFPAASVSEADIIAFCRSRLPHYMVPTSVVFGPLPKTSTGKIQKFLLRDKARAMGSLKKSSSRRSKL